MTTLPLASVYTHALQGHPCTVWEGDLAPQRLPTHAWLARAGAADLALLAHCQGPTIDIGCGPGRMSEALAEAGHAVLGIDVVPEAVRQTRTRGVAALRRSVFDRVPGEGRWETALLADGNIGIGGEPRRLLRRIRDLLGPAGTLLAEVSPLDVDRRGRARILAAGGAMSSPFGWADLGAPALTRLAASGGWAVLEDWDDEGRRFLALATPRDHARRRVPCL